jgi:mycothiol synthase
VSWFRNEELDSDWLRVLEVGGRTVGYGDIWIDDGEVAIEVAAPGHWHVFFDWAEGRARAECVGRVRAFFPAGHELEALVKRRGYRLWRSAYTMNVGFREVPPEAPSFPQGVELRAYRPGDAVTLRASLNEAFAGDPFFREVTPSRFREFYLGGRGFDPSLWLLAWIGDELAGFALTFPERPGEPELGWVQSLGVGQRWRRHGIGEALLRAAFGALHARGLRRVGLGVDAENESGALRLYERVGMSVVRRDDNWVLDLEGEGEHRRQDRPARAALSPCDQ